MRAGIKGAAVYQSGGDARAEQPCQGGVITVVSVSNGPPFVLVVFFPHKVVTFLYNIAPKQGQLKQHCCNTSQVGSKLP